MSIPDSNVLPVHRHADELVAAVESSRVIVVEGPTGSGKTTQIPRILLHRLGLRRIGVTQPRRIAAVSVAWRIAAEEGVEVGTGVGYAIRFDDLTSPATRIKLMTDGILLTEARSDPDLSEYDVIMIDEAHERSLNIDVSLGLLHQLLERREDLKVVVSSATLFPEQFQRFFGDVAGEVPRVSIDARVHPVEVFYRPVPSLHPRDLAELIGDRVAKIHANEPPGHVLVFLTGVDMIRRTQEAVEQLCPSAEVAVLPLIASLTRDEQERVFEDFGSRRKVVLATNIAETSITIPDVRYVIDCGLAKLPRFSPRTGITRLREEPISVASADQRAGRAGRTAPGLVFRLYSRDSLRERPAQTEPEILRLDLAEVILRLLDLEVRDLEGFPFPTAPPPGKVRAALETLTALGAIDDQRELTAIGRRMAPFPLSPSLARMVVEAAERFPNVVDDVLVVGAFLSGRTPFVLPEGDVDEARRAHARFVHPLGDATTRLRLYRAWEKSRDRDDFCTRNYLDGEVVAFAHKAHTQLREIAEEQGIEIRGGGAPEEVVRAVAAGLADKVIRRRGYVYETATGVRVALHPGCVLAGDGPDFAVAAELMEYARAYALNVSALHPDWLAEVNPRAAEAFGLRAHRRGRTPRPELTSVQLGALSFPVVAGRGRPLIEIPLDAIAALREVNPDMVPGDARRVRGRIRWDERVTFASLSLGKLLRLVREAPFPEPGAEPNRGAVAGSAFGEIFEADRGRHRIERALPHILEPAAIGRAAGWIALVANGNGGYWLDVISHYNDAVQTALLSLVELESELYDGDPLLEAVEAARQTVEDRDADLSADRPERPRRRRRRDR